MLHALRSIFREIKMFFEYILQEWILDHVFTCIHTGIRCWKWIKKHSPVFIILFFVLIFQEGNAARLEQIGANISHLISGEIQQNEAKLLQQEFETEIERINISEKDKKILHSFFHDDTNQLDKMENDPVLENGLSLSQTAVFAKLIIENNIDTDEVHSHIEKLRGKHDEHFESIVKLLKSMESYIEIEKRILKALNPVWEKELDDISIASVSTALASISAYNEFVESFAEENNFELRDKTEPMRLDSYDELVQQTALDTEMELSKQQYFGIEGMKTYRDLQETYKKSGNDL